MKFPPRVPHVLVRRVMMSASARYGVPVATSSLSRAPAAFARSAIIRPTLSSIQQRSLSTGVFMNTKALFQSAQPVDLGHIEGHCEKRAYIDEEGLLDDEDLFHSEAGSLHDIKWSLINVRNLTKDKRDLVVTVLNSSAYRQVKEKLHAFQGDPLDLEDHLEAELAEIDKKDQITVIVPYNEKKPDEYTTIALPNPCEKKEAFVIATEEVDNDKRFFFAGLPVFGGHKYKIEGESCDKLHFTFPKTHYDEKDEGKLAFT